MHNHYPTRKQAEVQNEALDRALSSQAQSNYPAIFHGFIEKGIAMHDIQPRDNVLTYHAWRAKGRQVRRGEHGVKITTWIPVNRNAPDASDEMTVGEETQAPQCQGKRPWTAVVFHVSQTDLVN